MTRKRSKFRVGLSGEFWDASGSVIYPGIEFSRLESEPGIELIRLPKRERVVAEDLDAVDAFITFWCAVDESALHDRSRVAVVARGGVGFDDMAVDKMTSLGIGYVNAPEAHAQPVALAAYTLMLGTMLRLVERDTLARGGREAWLRGSTLTGVDPRGLTLGMLGFGRINQSLARLSLPLGMRRLVYNRTPRVKEMTQLDCEPVDLTTLFRESDVLVICVALNQETRGMVSAARIAMMKPTAFVINVGRGALVDESALIVALETGRLAGAGLDVTQSEPIEAASPLLKVSNLVLTAHSLCITERCFRDAMQEAIDGVLALRRGETPATLVNREVMANPRWNDRLSAFAREG